MKSEEVQVAKTIYICDVCEAHFDWPSFATACEHKHMLENCQHDLFYYIEQNSLKVYCRGCAKLVREHYFNELDEEVLKKIEEIICPG